MISMSVKSFSIGVRSAVLAIALLVTPAAIGQRPHATAQDRPVWDLTAKNAVIDQMSKYVENSAYVPGIDFSTWQSSLAKIREDANKAQSEDEFAGLINKGLHDQFNISHIVLLPPRAVRARSEQKTVGIGVRIKLVDEGVLVTSTVHGAPAESAGIEAGDIIVEADGHKVDGPTYIAGPVGTGVMLKVKKADGKFRDYKLVRREFSTSQPEELVWVNKDTAAIAIHTFDLSYSPENVDKLMQEASKAKNLLVDLRGNGGGAVLYMMHFLSTVLDPGTKIGTFVNRKVYDNFVNGQGGDPKNLRAMADSAATKLTVSSGRMSPFKGHIAVLVDGGSGSASEITAEALKELKNAAIIGDKSAGAVLVSVMGQLPHGFNMQYPISDYISIKGVRLEANGIAPDLAAKSPSFLKKGEKDPAYIAAANYLKSMAKAGASG